MDFKFTAANLEELHKRASKWEPRDEWYNQDTVKLTQQDALSAYLIRLHNRCLEKPIHSLMNMMSVSSTILKIQLALYTNTTIRIVSDPDGGRKRVV